MSCEPADITEDLFFDLEPRTGSNRASRGREGMEQPQDKTGYQNAGLTAAVAGDDGGIVAVGHGDERLDLPGVIVKPEPAAEGNDGGRSDGAGINGLGH